MKLADTKAYCDKVALSVSPPCVICAGDSQTYQRHFEDSEVVLARLRQLIGKVGTAYRLLQADGISGVIDRGRHQAEVRAKLSAAKHINSVVLDDCIFSLERVPDTDMKVALLEKDYEIAERRAVQQYLNPDLPVIELGGCIGVVACITNRLLTNPQSHVVVEANPNAVPLIEDHRRQNHSEFEIVGAAIAYNTESVSFLPADDFCANYLHQRNGGARVTVPATTLGEIVDRKGFDSFTLICDIEGYEYDLVCNESEVLKKAQVLILETHSRIIGEEKNAAMLRKLEEIGMRKVREDSFVVVMERSAGSDSGAKPRQVGA